MPLPLSLSAHADGQLSTRWMGRMEVIADGLTLWQGARAGNRHHVGVLLSGGMGVRGGAARRAGPLLWRKRRRKETTNPELVGEGGRARLVVLAVETGGRWSDETAHFLRSLAKAKAESVPLLLQNRVEEVELHRGVQRREAFRSISPGTGRPTPWHGELQSPQGTREDRFA